MILSVIKDFVAKRVNRERAIEKKIQNSFFQWVLFHPDKNALFKDFFYIKENTKTSVYDAVTFSAFPIENFILHFMNSFSSITWTMSSPSLEKLADLSTECLRTASDFRLNSCAYTNRRGRAFNTLLPRIAFENSYNLIGYIPEENDCETKALSYYKDSNGKIFHVMSEGQIQQTLDFLITPRELFGFLSFKEKLITRHGEKVNNVSHSALLGQYISGNSEVVDIEPSEEFQRWTVESDISCKSKWEAIARDVFESLCNVSMEAYFLALQKLANLDRHQAELFVRQYLLSSTPRHMNDKDGIVLHSLDSGFIFLIVPISDSANEDDLNMKCKLAIHDCLQTRKFTSPVSIIFPSNYLKKTNNTTRLGGVWSHIDTENF